MAFTDTPEVQQLSDDSADFAFKGVLIALPAGEIADAETIGTMLKASIDKAISNNATAPDAIQTVEAGLKVVADGLTLGGKTALAADVEEGEVLIGNLESGTGNPVFAGIKTFFEKIFAPKKYAAAVAEAGK